ncbi:hypothetical protein GGF40_001328 [Coemansia sp. RSA 1286]|nr:hypothetical protein IWW45_007150 [Coemansia sp. RSA 485]KAJ2638852.1 hypothetical protein GGF40_001328 [Coemansia sp. RSA 1286]
MKRAQTPEGMVIHYENKLHNFLGLQQSPVDLDDNEWLFVDPDCIPQHVEESPHTLKGDKKINAAAKGAKHFDNPIIAQGIRDNMVSEWPLQDSYARLVVHTMCRYYGLVSFTSHNGKSNVLHICHPKLFNSSDDVVLPEISFHQFLFGSKN